MSDVNTQTDKKNDKIEAKEVKSQALTLANLGSKLSKEIKDQIQKQHNMMAVAEGSGLWGVALGPSEYATFNDYIGASGDDTTNENRNLDTVERLLTLIDKKGLVDVNIYMDEDKNKQVNNEPEDMKNMSLMFGRCPVINPPWQFGELDDVRSNRSYPLLGRVYLNYIYTNYPIVAIEPGRQLFALSPLDFIGFAPFGKHSILNSYIRNGGESGLLGTIGNGAAVIANTLTAIVQNGLGLFMSEENRFCKFKPAMKLFSRYVDELLRELAANMRLLDLHGEPDLALKETKEESRYLEMTKYEADLSYEGEDCDDKGNPIIKNHEVTAKLQANYTEKTPDTVAGEENWYKGIKAWLKNKIGTISKGYSQLETQMSQYRGSTIHLSLLSMLPKSFETDILDQNRVYVPFLVQKAISVSETFSNSSRAHPIAEELNSKSQEAEGKRNSAGLDIIAGAVGFKDPLEALKSIVQQGVSRFVGNRISNSAEMGMLLTGSGRALLPNMWASSNFERTYSIDFTFFSPSGDIVSIFENCYIPLTILMVLSAPLQTGKYLYTAPFTIRVFSKGLFSVSMGMIKSLNITRGQEKNDRTVLGFPRTIKCQVEIEDLSPSLMLSLGSGKFWRYREANVNLTEYIATLCNLSIADRFNVARKFKVFWDKLRAEVFDSTLNLDALGFNLKQKFTGIPLLTSWSKGNISVDSFTTRLFGGSG